MKNKIERIDKRQELLKASYDLFTTIGIENTTIQKITDTASVGKGTFYLYFKSKQDIKEALIAEKSAWILTRAVESLDAHIESSQTKLDYSQRILYIVDYIIEIFVKDTALLKFISKYLSWGFISSHYLDQSNENPLSQIIKLIEKKENVVLKDIRLLLFTIFELVNSTCYNAILDGVPVSIEEYKPYLFENIKLLVENSIDIKK